MSNYQGEGGESGGGGSSESWEPEPPPEQATANPEGAALEDADRIEWAWRLLAVAVALGVSWYLTRGRS